jgi:endonuclease/exonuclease/phosphatase family metal-dependent hydrolase
LVVWPGAETVPAAVSDAMSVKLVTYNIWGLPSWMTGAPKGRYARIAREIERLEPDIVLLQEAWTAKARRAVPTNGAWSVARAAGQHTFFQQSGLVTLSRFPIIGGGFYPFSHAALPDRLVNKGVLKVTLKLAEGQVLNIWNVHLQDGGTPELRISQVRELASRVRAAEDRQIADVIGGDFNCTPDSTLYRELENSLGPSVLELGGEVPFVTWDGLSGRAGTGETLDHIFIRRRTPFQEVRAMQHIAFTAATPQERLSDHFGIEAEVSFSAGPSVARAVEPMFESPAISTIAADRTARAGE